MLNRYFVDTSAFYALRNSGEPPEHELALSTARQLETERMFPVTTDYILDESYTLLRSDLGHKTTVALGREIQQSGIEIVQVDPSIQKEAWEIFESYSDKDFSFTDCTSFVVMKRAGLQIAFTFDRHFQQFGFRTVPVKLLKKGK